LRNGHVQKVLIEQKYLSCDPIPLLIHILFGGPVPDAGGPGPHPYPVHHTQDLPAGGHTRGRHLSFLAVIFSSFVGTDPDIESQNG
jgi:hypothetical protein